MQRIVSCRLWPNRPRHLILYIMVGLLAALVGTGAWAAADPSGLWLTPGDGSIIKIAPCKTGFCGTLAWLKEPYEADGSPKLDPHNPDPTKRGRRMLGAEIFLDLVPEDSHWRGKAYNPQDGKLYDVTFRLVGDEPLPGQAELQGCVLRILCQTQILTRVAALPKADATP